MAKRKRGAQPRNTNTRKHGFYSDRFTEDEMVLVAAFVNDISLDDEIWMQRVVNRRLLADNQVNDREMLVKIAGALTVGTGRVARLLRDQHVLSGKAANKVADAIAVIVEQVTIELGITEP